MAVVDQMQIHFYNVDPATHECSGSDLTAFERRALELFAAGLQRREIARQLNRAPKTISNCLTAARDKLGARSLAEAAAVISVEAISLALKVNK